MELETRHLRLIEALAIEGSLRRAAIRLKIGQPALSRALVRLESMIGAQLFVRTRSGVSLTDAGHILLNSADEIRRVFDDAQAQMRELGNTKRPVLKFASNGVGVDACLEYLSDQGMDVRASVISEDISIAMLARGELDLALVYLTVEEARRLPANLRSCFLKLSFFWCMMHREHPRARHDELRLADLATERFLLQPEGNLRRTLDRACEASGFTPIPAFVGGNELITKMLSRNNGITLGAPTASIYAPEEVVFRKLVDVPVTAMHVVWRPETVSRKIANDLVAELCFRNIAASRSSPEFWDWLTGSSYIDRAFAVY